MCFSEAHLRNERNSTDVKSSKATTYEIACLIALHLTTVQEKKIKDMSGAIVYVYMLFSSTYLQNETNIVSVKPCKAMSEAITSTHFLLFPSRSPRLEFIRLDSNVDQGKTMFKCSNTCHTNTPPRRKYFPTDIMTQKA